MRGAMRITLMEAIRSGNKESAKRILQQKCTNIEQQTTKKDGTALFWCCCQGYVDLVHLLLLHGANVNSCTAWGASPLHACADHNRVEILMLILHFGADVNLQTKNGDTACHLASYRGYMECVRTLVQHGANIELCNNKRHKPTQEAYTMRHFDIYQYLLNVQTLVKQNGSTQTTHDAVKPDICSPTAPPCDYYSLTSERNNSFHETDNKTMWHSRNNDYSTQNNDKSNLNSSISSPNNGLKCKNIETTISTNIAGVLRVKHENYHSDDEDSTESCEHSLTYSNDLSSIDTSVMPSLTYSNDLSSIDTSVMPSLTYSNDLSSIDTSVMPSLTYSNDLSSIDTSVIPSLTYSNDLSSIDTSVIPSLVSRELILSFKNI